MVTFALFLFLVVSQSAPTQEAPQRYTVHAIGPPRAFIDSSGNAVVYSDMATFYLWSGTPVAYYSAHDLYRFDGKHLGWIYNWTVYDHEGRMVVIAAALSQIPRSAIPSGNKGARPVRPYTSEERPPPKPPFTTLWSARSAMEFFTGGK